MLLNFQAFYMDVKDTEDFDFHYTFWILFASLAASFSSSLIFFCAPLPLKTLSAEGHKKSGVAKPRASESKSARSAKVSLDSTVSSLK
jgi:hypothetical protein